MDVHVFKTAFSRAADEKAGIMVDAMCEVYYQLTQKKVSDKLRDSLFDAVRFEV